MVKKNTSSAVADEQEAETSSFDVGEDMSFDLDVSEVPDTVLLPEGEYTMRVDNIEFKKSEKPGKPPYWYFNIRLGCVDEVTADDVYFMVPYPTPHDDDKTKLRKSRRLKEFLSAVGIDTSSGSWNPQDAVGSEFSARLKQTENNGQLRNEVAGIIH